MQKQPLKGVLKDRKGHRMKDVDKGSRIVKVDQDIPSWTIPHTAEDSSETALDLEIHSTSDHLIGLCKYRHSLTQVGMA